MDFVTGLPRGKKGNDAIWVVVDRLIKSVLFLPMKMTDSVDKLTKLCVNEVIKLHGVPVSIISDQDPKFTSRLWPSLQQALRTKLNLSTTFHPRRMVNLEGPFKLLRISWGPVCWSSERTGKISCHWWILLIIIAIKILLVWLNMKHCMGGNVIPQFVGRK
jgi:hypothetical protein